MPDPAIQQLPIIKEPWTVTPVHSPNGVRDRVVRASVPSNRDIRRVETGGLSPSRPGQRAYRPATSESGFRLPPPDPFHREDEMIRAAASIYQRHIHTDGMAVSGIFLETWA